MLGILTGLISSGISQFIEVTKLYKVATFFNGLRKKNYRREVKRRVARCGEDLSVNNHCIVTNTTYLGNNVNFNGMHIQGKGEVRIGDNFHSGIENMIITDIHNYEGEAIPYDETIISKDVIIEDNVWLGNRVIILPGVTIQEGAIVQAGSTVVKDVPSCAIVGGHPAKVFKYRDVQHYNQLKAEGKFH
ncbi:MAG: acyltransferase [Methanobacteriaceae archaeon]|nr:acyltransferase [Methanobacteriaceae archaeon]